MWIATAEHCRQIDCRASDEFGVSPRDLMERAGRAVFEAIRDFVPTGSHVAVVCGKGNNGGDGFVAARLARDHGYFIGCVVAARREEVRGLAREQMEIAEGQGVCICYCDAEPWSKKLDLLAHKDLIVDALLGTGARHEVHGPIRDAIHAINRSGVPVLAVDLPSGIACNTGQELGTSVWACQTVTMGLPKPALVQGIGLEHSGYWRVADIGHPPELLDEPTFARTIESSWAGSLLPERLRNCHKRENGSVLIVAGSRGMPGAATLVARAALRAGAGLVTVAGIASVCEAVAHHAPEALLMELPERDGVVDPAAAALLLDVQDRFTGAAFGPGLTHEPSACEFLGRLWEDWATPSVIDADALNAAALGVSLPKAACVLTPHPKEMSRLLETEVAEIEVDRFGAIRAAADRFQQCALLKGPFTLIAETDQPILVNTTGNPGLATGGMGDTLTGIVAALIAQELPPYYAAACAAHWHGYSADLCACEVGPVGYTASEVANKLPVARVRILASCESKPPCS